MRPHLKCMHEQVAVYKKHVSFWLVFKSARGYFPVVGIGAFDGLAQPYPLIASLQSLVAKARRARGKGNPLLQKGGKRQTWVHLASCQKPQTSRSESRPPMSKKRPTEVGATRGGPHHAPRLRPDQ